MTWKDFILQVAEFLFFYAAIGIKPKIQCLKVVHIKKSSTRLLVLYSVEFHQSVLDPGRAVEKAFLIGLRYIFISS
jgi:hypothetical protein